jgi:N6-L-threonylcarbamoyladenine synthase
MRTHNPIDNAAMIAWAAMPRFLAGDFDPPALEIKQKWDLESLEDVIPRSD